MKNNCFWMLSGLVAALFSFLVSVTPAYAMAEEPAEVLGDYIAELNFELARKQAEFEER